MDRQQQANLLQTYAYKRLAWVLYHTQENECKRILAQLRRDIGRVAGDNPFLWNVFLDSMPKELQSNSMEPSRAEYAIHTALTLFAFHQQGKDPKKHPMHKSGINLGTSVARLVVPGIRVQRNALGTVLPTPLTPTILRNLQNICGG